MNIDLDNLNIGFIRMLYIKAEAQFLFSTASSIALLNTATRNLAQSYVLDTGIMPALNRFVPDIDYPKFIRLMNPIEIKYLVLQE